LFADIWIETFVPAGLKARNVKAQAEGLGIVDRKTKRCKGGTFI
jgi:hypothetical protein